MGGGRDVLNAMRSFFFNDGSTSSGQTQDRRSGDAETSLQSDAELAWELQRREMVADERNLRGQCEETGATPSRGHGEEFMRQAVQQQRQDQQTDAQRGVTARNGRGDVCYACGRGFSMFGMAPRVHVSGESSSSKVHFHMECFVCAACGDRIATGTQIRWHNSEIYHPTCASRLFDPRCAACDINLREFAHDANGMIWFRTLPYWSDKNERLRFCSPCVERQNACCFSCNRLRLVNEPEMSTLSDGRMSCFSCQCSAIFDTDDAKPLYDEVASFFSSLGMSLKYLPPLMLVDLPALNDAAQSTGTTRHHHNPHDGHRDGGDGRTPTTASTTRGLTLSEERTIRTVVRSGLPGLGSSGGGGGIFGERVVSTATNCEVTAILVLAGMPRLLTGAILAHEMMHAWFRLCEFGRVATKIEEGLCQLLSYMWITCAIDGADPSEKEAGKFFKWTIMHDTSEIYGEGFRDALICYETYGLASTLDYLRTNRRLPLS